MPENAGNARLLKDGGLVWLKGQTHDQMVLQKEMVETILAEVVSWFPCALSRLKPFPTDAVLELFPSISLFAANTAMVDNLVNLRKPLTGADKWTWGRGLRHPGVRGAQCAFFIF